MLDTKHVLVFLIVREEITWDSLTALLYPLQTSPNNTVETDNWH